MKMTHMGLLLAFSLILAACQNNPESDSSEEALEVNKENFAGSTDFQIDTRMSTVSWKGTQNVSNKTHTGNIKVKDGTLKVKDGQLVGGKVMIDMNSLIVTDLQGTSKGKLEGHLKADDFFSVESYPTASFEIADITPVDTIGGASHIVSGNLTIKDITKSISFPTQVRMVEDAVLATSLPFKINRTEWGVNHRSGLMGTIKDKIIEDEVGLSLKVRATLAK